MTGFFKVSGSGNDFLALVPEITETTGELPAPETIRAWCRRGVSIGADGLFLLRRSGTGVVMDYANADGHPAELCLNGTRCAAQLAFHLGWAQDTLTIETGAGTVTALRCDATRVTLQLEAPGMPEQRTVETASGIRYAGHFLRVGVPHFILLWPESLDRAPVEILGPELRHHPAFGADGANVSFVRHPAPGRMEIRTWERGVEAETLSCGSGVIAAAAVGVHAGRAVLPLRVAVQGGFDLEVAAGQDGWRLTGDARVVACGTLLDGAAASPSPPSWA